MIARGVRHGVLILLLVVSLVGSGRAADTGPTVAAALSLKRAFEGIGRLYDASHRSAPVRFNFAASGVLQRQIEGGAPVDVFASASAREMDALDRDGLLAKGSRTVFARNGMVLIVPRGSRLGIAGIADLGRENVERIVIGNPATVPAGKYAMEALRSLGLGNVVREKLIFAEHVRQVVDYTVRGEADAGIVFATDAAGIDTVAVADTVPAASHTPALYHVALMRDAANAEAGRAFIDLLRSESGQALLSERGFQRIP